jgi:hypothetical protein
VKFEHATGYIQDRRTSRLYNARFYEGRAVIGHIAGKMTETNTVGYIASFPIPEVIMGINSAYLHAKAVNPDVQFRVVWVYSWFDPAQGGRRGQRADRAGRRRADAAHRFHRAGAIARRPGSWPSARPRT